MTQNNTAALEGSLFMWFGPNASDNRAAFNAGTDEIYEKMLELSRSGGEGSHAVVIQMLVERIEIIDQMDEMSAEELINYAAKFIAQVCFEIEMSPDKDVEKVVLRHTRTLQSLDVVCRRNFGKSFIAYAKQYFTPAGIGAATQ